MWLTDMSGDAYLDIVKMAMYLSNTRLVSLGILVCHIYYAQAEGKSVYFRSGKSEADGSFEEYHSKHRAIHTASEHSTYKHSVDQRIGGRLETPHARHPDHQNDGWVTQVQCIQKADTH